MRFIVLLFFFLFTEAFAGESKCRKDVVDAHLNHFKVEKKVTRSWNKFERGLIHQMMTKVASWVGASDELHAVHAFVHPEDYAREPSRAGKIVYLSKNNVRIAYVGFHPGEAEQGAYFLLSSPQSPKLIAMVDDGYLECDI